MAFSNASFILCTIPSSASKNHTRTPFISISSLQVRPRLLYTPRLVQQVRLASGVLARLSSSHGASLGHLDVAAGSGGARLQSVEKLDGGFGSKVLVVFVVDLDHGGVDAGTEALDLDEGKQAVGGGLALLNAEVLGDGLDDGIRAAATQLARSL